MDDFEESVIDRRLRLLDARNVIAWGIDAKIHCRRAHHLSAVVPAQPYRQQPLLLSLLKSSQHINRIAACRDSHGDVASPSVSYHLASKDIVESNVIPYGRDHGDVIGQRDRGQR